MPNVLHYGLLFEIKEAGYSFDKHWFQKFDALQCPPWEDSVEDLPNPVKGLFPFPPHPSTLTAKVRSWTQPSFTQAMYRLQVHTLCSLLIIA